MIAIATTCLIINLFCCGLIQYLYLQDELARQRNRYAEMECKYWQLRKEMVLKELGR